MVLMVFFNCHGKCFSESCFRIGLLTWNDAFQGWVISESAGDENNAAIAQGSIGYCPNDYKASMYFYTSAVRNNFINKIKRTFS